MALVKCVECGNEISDKAKHCPSCGSPPPKKTSAVTWFALVCIVGVFIQVMFNLSSSSNDHAAVQAPPVATGYDLSKMDSVKSITVRGREIKVKDLHDQVVDILKKEDRVWQTDSGPQDGPERVFVDDYLVDGKKFSVSFARVQYPGPYKVVGIWKAKP